MMTDDEKELIKELSVEDFYAAQQVVMLSRYHRIARETAIFDIDLAPTHFSAIVSESFMDVAEYLGTPLDEEEG